MKGTRPACILRIDNPGDVPEGYYHVPRSEGKTTGSTLNRDPWYVYPAHMLFRLFLKLPRSR